MLGASCALELSVISKPLANKDTYDLQVSVEATLFIQLPEMVLTNHRDPEDVIV